MTFTAKCGKIVLFIFRKEGGEVVILWITAIIVVAALSRIIIGVKREERKGRCCQDAGLQSLVREGYAIAADLLEAGQAVFCLSEGTYQGTLSVRFHRREGDRYVITVCMYDSGDLISAWAKQGSPSDSRLNRDPEAIKVMEHFVRTYGACYDRERDALVCQTRQTVGLTTEEKCQAETLLHRKLRTHPLAIFEDISLIHTRGLGNF